MAASSERAAQAAAATAPEVARGGVTGAAAEGAAAVVAKLRAAGPQLPWVNPARCLTACASDPPTPLERVNPQAESDARGRHRIAVEIQAPLRALLEAARSAGHALRLESAFRSYDEQTRLYSTMKEVGRAARPGHSEHQLGTAVDLRLPTGAAIEWLEQHAPEFGFTLSYPPNKQRLTGYRPEPWHIRFVGRELALELQGSHTILEEAFRLQPPPSPSASCGDCPSPVSQAACGELGAAGSCSGTILSWCYDGVLATVDCALSGQKCALSESEGVHDCLPKVSPPSPPSGS